MSWITDVSIDIETLSTRFDAAVLSIGAVPFNRKTGKIGTGYYAEIDIDESIKHGHVMGSTLAWWADQDAKARRVFSKQGTKRTMYDALQGLSDLIRQAHAPCVWGHGATFDITILEHAYLRGGNGLIPWWKYTNIRDVRTIIDAAGVDPYKMARKGTHHNALDDAAFQAELVIESFRIINIGHAARQELESKPGKRKPAPPPTIDEDDEL